MKNLLFLLSFLLLSTSILLFVPKNINAQGACTCAYSGGSSCNAVGSNNCQSGFAPQCEGGSCVNNPQCTCVSAGSGGGGGGSAKIDFPGLESISVPSFAGRDIGAIVSELVKYLFPLAGLLLLLYLIYGGYRYMLSRGDPKPLQEARSVITTALIGFVIVFISFWLVQIIGTALGLDVITAGIFK